MIYAELVALEKELDRLDEMLAHVPGAAPARAELHRIAFPYRVQRAAKALDRERAFADMIDAAPRPTRTLHV